MTQYINKSALVVEIERLISSGQVKLQESQESNDYESYVTWSEHIATCIKVLSIIDTLEVKKVEECKQPEYSCLETIYQCGKKPHWNVGDTLTYYEFYSDREGECVLGKVTKVKFDEEQCDWFYTFEDGSQYDEASLLEEKTYKKN